MKLTAINSNDRDWTHNRYVLAFGAYGDTKLLVWANNLDDALDECIDWIADNAPGLLCDDQVIEQYKELEAAGHSSEYCHGQSTIDATCGGNYSHYINSWEWSIYLENPTRAQLLELTGNHEKRRLARVQKAKRTGRPFPKHKSSRLLLTSVSDGAKV